MKRVKRIVLAAAMLMFPATCVLAMKGELLSVEKRLWHWSEGFDNEVRSDPPGSEDESTVTGKLEPVDFGATYNFYLKDLTKDSLDLRVGLDLTAGISYRALFQTFDPGFQKLDYAIIQGTSLSRFILDYEFSFNNPDDSFPSIEVEAEPVPPAITTSHVMMNYQGGAGIRFNYDSPFDEREDRGQSLVVTDAYLDDIGPAMHPSSDPSAFWGLAINVNGVDQETVQFEFYLSASYLARGGLGFEDVKGYVDGEIPSVGFTFEYRGIVDDIDLNLGSDDPDEEYGRYFVSYSSWSQHDIQVGVLPGPADSDDDGMPDDYEMANGLDKDLNDALIDSDGDGAVNIDEFRAGTLAGSADSVFKIVQISDGPMISVTWHSVPGKTYSLETASGIQGDWLPVDGASDIVATETSTTVQIEVPAGGEDVFVRVGVE